MTASSPALLMTVATTVLPRKVPCGQVFQGDDGQDVIAVDQLAALVAEEDAVGVAVVGEAEVGLVLADQLAKMFRVHGAAVPVDVGAVGFVAVNDDFGAQFAQDAGGGFVGGAMGAIHHHAQALQRQIAREGAFGVFDVTAQGVVNAHGLADGVGGGADGVDFAAEDQFFDRALRSRHRVCSRRRGRI